MNKLKLLQELSERFDDFKMHPDLVTDIIGILSNSGKEKSFLLKLTNALSFLQTFGKEAHLQPTKQFENLKNESNMYSMHIQGSGYNVRILYSFLDNGSVLLHGFYERQGKAATDYSLAIVIAKKRYKDMEGIL